MSREHYRALALAQMPEQPSQRVRPYGHRQFINDLPKHRKDIKS